MCLLRSSRSAMLVGRSMATQMEDRFGFDGPGLLRVRRSSSGPDYTKLRRAARFVPVHFDGTAAEVLISEAGGLMCLAVEDVDAAEIESACFLGMGEDGTPYFANDRGMRCRSSVPPGSGDWISLRAMLRDKRISRGDLTIAGHACALMSWHRQSSYHPTSGARTVSIEGGCKRGQDLSGKGKVGDPVYRPCSHTPALRYKNVDPLPVARRCIRESTPCALCWSPTLWVTRSFLASAGWGYTPAFPGSSTSLNPSRAPSFGNAKRRQALTSGTFASWLHRAGL